MIEGQSCDNGCMKRPFIVVGLALVAVLAIGCGSGDDDVPKPHRTTLNPTPAERDQANVNALCDYFYVRAIETLSSSGAHATINDLASKPGIPGSLRNKAKDFTGANNEAAYKSVIRECQGQGWTP